MTTMNLMTGDLVITANNKKATVMRNTNIGDILRFHSERDSFSYLNKRYNDNLTHKTCKGLTITKVYRVDSNKIEASKIGDLIANPDKMLEFGSLIYDRDGSSPRVPTAPAFPVEETKNDKPTIADLMTGDMLVHKDGKVSTVYKDTIFGDIIRYATEKNSFTYLYRFDNESLTHESKDEYDIIAVFRANKENEGDAGDAITNPGKMFTPENAVWVNNGSFAAEWYRNGQSYGIEYPNYTDYAVDDCDDDEEY